MNSAIILTAISLLLGLIGTLTKTSTDGINGKKKITGWGYCVVILMIISATTAVITQIKTSNENKKNKERQLAESKQQKLLSLMAVSSNFTIEHDPFLNLVFYDEYSEKGNLLDSAKSSLYDLFPGFGVKDVTYRLEMNISDSKNDFIEGSGIVMDDSGGAIDRISETNSVQTDTIQEESEPTDEETPAPLKLSYTSEAINNEMNYLWTFSGYSSLTELLLDFQEGREIGTLTFMKKKSLLSDKELNIIKDYIQTFGSWEVRVYIKNKTVKSNLLHLAIPIKISGPQKTGNGYEFKLTSGQPEIGSYQFSPV